jgi:hypothetical protein
MGKSFWFSGLFALACTLAVGAADVRAQVSDHLLLANDYVDHILPENNTWATNPSSIGWVVVNGQPVVVNRTQCSTFVSLLVRQARGLTTTNLKAWTGSTSPSALVWYNTIQAQNGFQKIDSINDVLPGDIMAYTKPSGGTTTGHIMFVNKPPVLRTPTLPIIEGTQQYEIEVVDSSSSGHGATDTRMLPNGTKATGIGRGVFRVYTNPAGKIVGHTWSTFKNSVYNSTSSYPTVVGRLR